jgi:hypothetical protein
MMRRVCVSILFSLLSACASQEVDRQANSGNSSSIYYVDASHGDDAADGRSEATPWKTLLKIREADFKPGDSILLKRGEVWFDTFWIRNSGTERAPIHVGAYGSGTPPILSGAITATELDWIKGAGGLWVAALPASEGEEPVKAYIGDTVYPNEHLKERVRRLKDDGDWAWENGNVYVKAKQSPAQWKVPLEFNVRRYSMDFEARSHIQVEDVAVMRSRDGIRLSSTHDFLKNVKAYENSLNGIVITGNWNRIENGMMGANGVVTMPGKTGRTGSGIFVEGTQNEIISVGVLDNAEDGIQFGPEAGDGNVVRDATIAKNGENCIDVKNGNQRISGGTFKSDAPSSEDCILVHKEPKTLRIEGATISALTKGPAVTVMDHARVSLEACTLKSEESSVILLMDSAGDGSVILDSKIGPGGSKSKALIEVRAGTGHKITGNTYDKGSALEIVKKSPGVEILESDER